MTEKLSKLAVLLQLHLAYWLQSFETDLIVAALVAFLDAAVVVASGDATVAAAVAIAVAVAADKLQLDLSRVFNKLQASLSLPRLLKGRVWLNSYALAHHKNRELRFCWS